MGKGRWSSETNPRRGPRASRAMHTNTKTPCVRISAIEDLGCQNTKMVLLFRHHFPSQLVCGYCFLLVVRVSSQCFHHFLRGIDKSQCIAERESNPLRFLVPGEDNDVQRVSKYLNHDYLLQRQTIDESVGSVCDVLELFICAFPSNSTFSFPCDSSAFLTFFRFQWVCPRCNVAQSHGCAACRGCPQER